MTTDLVLRPSCSVCGSSSDLYGSNCKHTTLCVSCGKSMAEKKAKCSDCGATLTRLIREYSVLANAVDDKEYFIGRFSTGVPKKLEKKKKNCENKWSLYKKKSKDGLQGRQDSFQDKLLKNKTWVLEDETGQSQYQGQPEEQSAAYYILMRVGKEISAIPASSWFNFSKVAQYTQFTLEEAEEKMNIRKKAQHGYERWMMKAATNGAVAFSEVDKFGGKDSKNTTGDDDDEGNFSDKVDEDEEEEGAMKNRHRAKKRVGDDEGASADDDLDDEADDSEKGDDWEHEEIFSDDDENNPEEIEDFATEVPAPPKLKKDDDEDDNNEEEGGLSKSGKELKKLLGRLDESDTEDEDDDDNDNEDMGNDIDDSPLKPVASGSAQTTPSTTKGKRKSNDYDAKAPTSTPSKKVKTETDQKPSVKVEHAPAGPVTEEEIKAVLMQQSPITMRDLISNFSGRLGLPEEKAAFTAILKRMRSQKTIYKTPKDDGTGSLVILRKKVN